MLICGSSQSITFVLALSLTATLAACSAQTATCNPITQAGSFVGKLARVTLGMSEDEALLKALTDHQAGKPKEQIEKELESNKAKYGLIDRTGKVAWSGTD